MTETSIKPAAERILTFWLSGFFFLHSSDNSRLSADASTACDRRVPAPPPGTSTNNAAGITTLPP